MMINRVKFFDSIRSSLFSGTLSKSQVDGISVILDKWEQSKYTDIRWLSYMLATSMHETGSTMQPIREWGLGKGRDYGKKLKMGGGAGKRIPYNNPKEIYYGRGLVQLTWYENYELMGRLLGIDLLNNPDLALDQKIAVDIMFEGMTKGSSSFGDFTGKCLEQYFNKTNDNPFGARAIINSKDRAKHIADIYEKFKTALV